VDLLKRHVRPDVEDALGVSRVVALVGPRQAGKSTLASQIARDVLRTTLQTFDDDATRAFAQNDPAGFISSLSLPAAIDEVQRAPGVMLAIKRIVDGDTRAGRFLITGSADLRVLATIPDALPGRVEYLDLWPFSQGELTGVIETFLDKLRSNEPPAIEHASIGLVALADRIAIGGFPASSGMGPRRRVGFFSSYLTSLLGRDLTEVSSIRKDEALLPLLTLLAVRSGSLLNMTRLGSELRIEAKTVESYISLLQQLGLVIRLPAWFSNLGKRVVKAPKLHIADSGLHAYLVGSDASALSRSPEIAGPALETFVVNELVRQSGWAESAPTLHHFRSHGGDEVDVVLQWRGGDVAGVEVKSAASIGPRDFAGLTKLRDALGAKFVSGVVLYTGERTISAGDRLWAVPVQGLWSRMS
jgi:uncharacterized protein